MTPTELHNEALKRGLKLRPAGSGLLGISPTEVLDRDLSFREELRARKFELLKLLHEIEVKYVAKRVLLGELDALDEAKHKATMFNLFSLDHALCKMAIDHLNKVH